MRPLMAATVMSVTILQQMQLQNPIPSGVGSGVLLKTQSCTLPCLRSIWQKLPRA